jgi:hypothetical protein
MADSIAAQDLGIAGADPIAPSTDADRARVELETLKASPEFVKQHLGGSHETRDQIEKLVQRIHTPPPGSVTFGAASLEQQRNQVADDLAETGPGLSEAHVIEIRLGLPNSPEIYREALSKKEALMRDPIWTASYLRGEFEAQRTIMLLNIIISNPVKLES